MRRILPEQYSEAVFIKESRTFDGEGWYVPWDLFNDLLVENAQQGSKIDALEDIISSLREDLRDKDERIEALENSGGRGI